MPLGPPVLEQPLRNPAVVPPAGWSCWPDYFLQEWVLLIFWCPGKWIMAKFFCQREDHKEGHTFVLVLVPRPSASLYIAP